METKWVVTMELIWNQTGNELEKLTKASTPDAIAVWAAIAYATDASTLLDICWKTQKPLKFYARYDHSGPVSDVVLNWFLSKNAQSANYDLNLIPDIFHPKVIWWRGVGAYIGSANLSSSAWARNIEAGIFLSEQELTDNGLLEQLESFFNQVRSKAYKVTPEIAQELIQAREALAKIQWPQQQEFNRKRILPRLESIISITRQPSTKRRKDAFLKEWHETLQYLRDIGVRLLQPQNTPKWLPAGATSGVVADQFLHAYYYNKVKDGSSYPYPEMHNKNKHNKEKALADAFNWWSTLESAPTSEDIRIGTEAPLLKGLLAQGKLLSLTENEFIELCKLTYAVVEHARRLSHKTFGLEHKLPNMARDQRTEFFAQWLFKQRSKSKQSPLQVIYYVAYGGKREDTAHRLFDANYDEHWKIPHIGISTLGEMVGLAMPEFFPPRNGRTSKALKSLGYDVTIHSE